MTVFGDIMKAIKTINKCLLNAIYFLTNEKVSRYIKELKETEILSNKAMQKYQKEKLIKLINYVTANNAYYNEAIKQDKYTTIKRNDIYNLNELPIVDKQFLKDNLQSFVDKKFKQYWRSTSGTTGTPFSFTKDCIATGYMDAMMYNVYSWHGIEIGDKQARLWGRALKPKERFIQNVKDLILNRKRLSAFEMNENNCIKYFEKLIRFKPKYFYSYSNALYQFAAFLENNRLDGKRLGVHIAICTGEVLFSHQRKKIAEVFGCKVVNEYGSTENGIIGFECEYGKMHVMPTVVVEIDNPDENGLGHIVVTEINSRSIPFIRYKIGDIGKVLKDTCECKRPYEIIEIHEGRIDDYIRCPDGRLVYDAILAYTLKGYALQFKAYQENINSLKIYLVPNDNYNIHTEATVKKILQRYLGEEINIEIIQVEKIPFETTGKFRYFVSNVNRFTA